MGTKTEYKELYGLRVHSVQGYTCIMAAVKKATESYLKAALPGQNMNPLISSQLGC